MLRRISIMLASAAVAAGLWGVTTTLSGDGQADAAAGVTVTITTSDYVSTDAAAASGSDATPPAAGTSPAVTPPPPARATTTPATPATAAVASSRNGLYYAFGDSVAAGAGLPYANPAHDAQCGRSAEAYPYHIANTLGLPLVHAACGGATAGDLVTHQGVEGPNIDPQLQTAFASGTPSLITITAGANDAHWDDFIRACYFTTCGGRLDQAVASTYLIALKAKLYYVFADISHRSGGAPPTTIVTGYYDPYSPACTTSQDRLTPDEIVWLQSSLQELNETIREVAGEYAYTRFVQPDFTGHGICSADPWVQGPGDKAPFHPNAAGQRAIADAVLAAYRLAAQ